MSARSWFSIRTTTSWSKLFVASEWIGRETAESPGATRGNTLHATTARVATRIEAAMRNACGRPAGGIKGTSGRGTRPEPTLYADSATDIDIGYGNEKDERRVEE